MVTFFVVMFTTGFKYIMASEHLCGDFHLSNFNDHPNYSIIKVTKNWRRIESTGHQIGPVDEVRWNDCAALLKLKGSNQMYLLMAGCDGSEAGLSGPFSESLITNKVYRNGWGKFEHHLVEKDFPNTGMYRILFPVANVLEKITNGLEKTK